MLTEAPGISVFNAESSAFTMYLTLLPNVTGGEIVTKSCAARETGHVADVADGGDRHRSSSEAKQRTALPILVVAVRAIKGKDNRIRGYWRKAVRVLLQLPGAVLQVSPQKVA